MNDILLLMVLSIAAIQDIKTREVSNKLILPGILIGAIISFATRQYSNIIAAILVFTVLALVYKLKQELLPGGDIKGLILIVVCKGFEFFVLSLYYMILVSIPILMYIMIKCKITKTKDVPPLVVSMALSVIIIIVGGYYA